MPEPIYTIGHSNHPLEHFLHLLKRHGITALGDVRSAPYSRRTPQFNREALAAALKAAGIAYVYLGRELGARSDDPAAYRDGRVQYDLLARTPLFQSGLERVKKGAAEYRLALMCAEKDPLNCHRTVLVARALAGRGASITHILGDGALETQREAGLRLAGQWKLGTDLLRAEDDLIAEAFRLQSGGMGYAVPAEKQPAENGNSGAD